MTSVAMDNLPVCNNSFETPNNARRNDQNNSLNIDNDTSSDGGHSISKNENSNYSNYVENHKYSYNMKGSNHVVEYRDLNDPIRSADTGKCGLAVQDSIRVVNKNDNSHANNTINHNSHVENDVSGDSNDYDLLNNHNKRHRKFAGLMPFCDCRRIFPDSVRMSNSAHQPSPRASQPPPPTSNPSCKNRFPQPIAGTTTLSPSSNRSQSSQSPQPVKSTSSSSIGSVLHSKLPTANSGFSGDGSTSTKKETICCSSSIATATRPTDISQQQKALVASIIASTPNNTAARQQIIQHLQLHQRVNINTDKNVNCTAHQTNNVAPAAAHLITQVSALEQSQQVNQPLLLTPTVPTYPNDGLKNIIIDDGDTQNRIPLLGNQAAKDKGKKTLVLDLDETLVHSAFKPVACYAFQINVDIEGQNHKIYVSKRPGVDEFLAKVADLYEIVVFTASLEKYANPVIDLIDPLNTCRWRLFRESCSQIFMPALGTLNYVKDLSRLGRDLRHVIIVDNSPFAYSLQPENAIPIRSWFDDDQDRELYELVPILQELSKVDDVPQVMRNALPLWE